MVVVAFAVAVETEGVQVGQVLSASPESGYWQVLGSEKARKVVEKVAFSWSLASDQRFVIRLAV